MKVVIDGKDFAAWWDYDERKKGIVWCHIVEFRSEGKFTPIASAQSICSVKDTFNRAAGRKVALTKALKNGPVWFGKDVRKLFWDAYAEMTNASWSSVNLAKNAKDGLMNLSKQELIDIVRRLNAPIFDPGIFAHLREKHDRTGDQEDVSK